ncbi:MAG: nucleotidyltransferase domain-containing protein [Proteobacteria bacterium]|nr:nucleotidyltransferase domain-containing protein [Pseudomonadota bacterium]
MRREAELVAQTDAWLSTRLPDLQALYLFGSTAAGHDQRDSDLDLAVLLPRPLTALARWELEQGLAHALGRDVDLVDLRGASTVMRVQVVAYGRLLIDRDPPIRALFEALALSDYARLNEERRAILRDVQLRGSVYG